jgi:hypothetical protein
MSSHISHSQPARITLGKPTRERHDAVSACKICGAPAPVLWLREEREPIPVYDFFGPDYVRPYYRCPDCDFIFCTDFDALCTDELNWIYDGMATQSKIEGRLNRGVRELQMLVRFAQLQGIDLRRAKTLVFGCGTGLSFNLMLRNEMRAWATDYARFDFADVDYQDTIYIKSLAPLMRKKFICLDQLPAAEFDMVTMTEVFEHLTSGRNASGRLPDRHHRLGGQNGYGLPPLVVQGRTDAHIVPFDQKLCHHRQETRLPRHALPVHPPPHRQHQHVLVPMFFCLEQTVSPGRDITTPTIKLLPTIEFDILTCSQTHTHRQKKTPQIDGGLLWKSPSTFGLQTPYAKTSGSRTLPGVTFPAFS